MARKLEPLQMTRASLKTPLDSFATNGLNIMVESSIHDRMKP